MHVAGHTDYTHQRARSAVWPVKMLSSPLNKSALERLCLCQPDCAVVLRILKGQHSRTQQGRVH